MESRRVFELPIIDQSQFMPLIEDMSGKTYKLLESKYGHAEEEAIIGLIMKAISIHGKWEPLLVSEILELMMKDDVRRIIMFRNQADNFFTTLEKVVKGNDIEIVNYKNNGYIIPLPSITQTINNSKVICYSVPGYQPSADLYQSDPETISAPIHSYFPKPKLGFFARLRHYLGF